MFVGGLNWKTAIFIRPTSDFNSAQMKSHKKFNLMSMQIANEMSAKCMWVGWKAKVAVNWDLLMGLVSN